MGISSFGILYNGPAVDTGLNILKLSYLKDLNKLLKQSIAWVNAETNAGLMRLDGNRSGTMG